MNLRCILLFALLTIVSCFPCLSQESTEPGALWKGSLKILGRKDGKPNFTTHDCRLIILQREGDAFEGEYWWSNDKFGVKVEGVISKGKVKFTSTGDLRGESKDLVDNVRVQGKLIGKEQNEMQLKFAVPGTNPRTGEIKLKRQQ
jgi:hypothetical protein